MTSVFHKHLGIAHFTGKFVKTPEKSAVFDHRLLYGLKASCDNYSVLLEEAINSNFSKSN